jgi:hypothetical protein
MEGPRQDRPCPDHTHQHDGEAEISYPGSFSQGPLPRSYGMDGP